MRSFPIVIEKCRQTGQFIGHVPDLKGAYSVGDTLDELRFNMKEVIELVLEDTQTDSDSDFVGVEVIEIGEP